VLNLNFLKIRSFVVMSVEIRAFVLDVVEMPAGLFEGFGKLGGVLVSRFLQGRLRTHIVAEDGADLLEGLVLCFGEEEVEDDDEDHVADDEDQEEFPGDGFDGDGSDYVACQG
jgi:hypothetical protein